MKGATGMTMAVLEGLIARAKKKRARDVMAPAKDGAALMDAPEGEGASLSDEELAELLAGEEEEPSAENEMEG